HALEEPHRTAVAATEADLHVRDAAVLPDRRDETIAIGGLEIELGRVEAEELLLRLEAEHARHRVVAFEHPPVDGVAIDAGEVALEKETQTLLARAQRVIRALALDRAREDLADDPEQPERFVGPRILVAE